MDTNKRFSGKIGQEYDLFSAAVPHHDELQSNVRQFIKEYAAAHPEFTTINVIEVGCGTGITTREILGADDRIRVWALDTDAKMLAQARENLASYGARVHFFSDARQILFPRTFHVIASAYTLHNIPLRSRLSLVRRLAARLKRGGLYVNADKYARDEILEHWRDLRFQIDAFSTFAELGRSDLQEEWTSHYLEDEATRCSEKTELTFLQGLGFSGARVVYRSGMDAVVCACRT